MDNCHVNLQLAEAAAGTSRGSAGEDCFQIQDSGKSRERENPTATLRLPHHKYLQKPRSSTLEDPQQGIISTLGSISRSSVLLRRGRFP